MKMYSLFLGSRNTRKASRFTAADERVLSATTAKFFPVGFTLVNAKGSWWNAASRRLEREESRQIHVSALRVETVKRWAREVGKLLDQEEVLVVEVGKFHRIKVKAPRKRR